jgi:hypothetical protein
MRVAGLLTVGVLAFLASGCGGGTAPHGTPPTTQRTALDDWEKLREELAKPPLVARPLGEREEGVIYVTVGADGQITRVSTSPGTEGESLGKTLKALRKAIEGAAKEAKPEGNTKPADKPDEKAPAITIKVEADAEGNIKAIRGRQIDPTRGRSYIPRCAQGAGLERCERPLTAAHSRHRRPVEATVRRPTD